MNANLLLLPRLPRLAKRPAVAPAAALVATIAALSLAAGPAMAQDASAPMASPGGSAPRADLVIRTMGPISYVCGGIGDDEQRQLAAHEKNFNMALMFTQGERGEYLSDVDVVLMREGHEVARFKAAGPRCLIRAPEGSYNVQATYNGQPKTVSVSTGTRNAQIRW